MNRPELLERIFSLSSTPKDFEQCSLNVFQYQFNHNPVYRKFCKLIGVDEASDITNSTSIPFLPIQFFKTHTVRSTQAQAQEVFTSSGTTGSSPSKHYVADRSVYEMAFRKGFQQFYGNIDEYVVLALLPSYLERKGSSLIYMARDFISKSQHVESGFYLNELDHLSNKLQDLDQSGKKILLLGVSFALLDLIDRHNFNLENTVVMETGGMKGRRKEMVREELHGHLKNGFGVSDIHSEYGMTEMLSQAYSKGEGVFNCPPYLNISIRNTENPFEMLEYEKTGGLNIIDLANLDSCSFIATQDLAKKHTDGSFEVLGRFDQSDLRGCNLMLLEN